MVGSQVKLNFTLSHMEERHSVGPSSLILLQVQCQDGVVVVRETAEDRTCRNFKWRPLAESHPLTVG